MSTKKQFQARSSAPTRRPRPVTSAPMIRLGALILAIGAVTSTPALMIAGALFGLTQILSDELGRRPYDPEIRVGSARMFTLGLILLIAGLLLAVPILKTVGFVLLLIGLVLFVAHELGRADRRYY